MYGIYIGMYVYVLKNQSGLYPSHGYAQFPTKLFLPKVFLCLAKKNINLKLNARNLCAAIIGKHIFKCTLFFRNQYSL